jgi:hypothetical protein
MTDADHFRGQAARCLRWQRQAKRVDVREALRSLAHDYEIKAQAAGRTPWAAAWPLVAMQMTGLLALNLAFWLGFSMTPDKRRR